MQQELDSLHREKAQAAADKESRKVSSWNRLVDFARECFPEAFDVSHASSRFVRQSEPDPFQETRLLYPSYATPDYGTLLGDCRSEIQFPPRSSTRDASALYINEFIKPSKTFPGKFATPLEIPSSGLPQPC